jgi:hypothetical protein
MGALRRARLCAWKAVYLQWGPLRARLGIDSGVGAWDRPKGFAGLSWDRGFDCSCNLWIPWLTWRTASRHQWVVPLYQLLERFRFRVLDGRFQRQP